MLMIQLLFLLLAVNVSMQDVEERTFVRGGSPEIKTFCSDELDRCQHVGSAGPWLLSIFETSIKPCYAVPEVSEQVRTWLDENEWLLDHVRAMSSNYKSLLNTQLTGLWTPDTKDEYVKEICAEISRTLLNKHPLNERMR